MSKYTSAQLAKGYLKVKAQIAELDAEYKANLAPLKEMLSELEQMIATALHEEGVKSINTEDGTVGRQTRTIYKASDITQVRTFALENNWTELLKLDLSSTGVKAYIEANDGQLPPGVQTVEIESIYHRTKKS